MTDDPVGLARGAVELRPHDPAWAGLFERERAAVLAAAGRLVVAVEHVGSTAVPGLEAKPVLDLQAGLRRFTDVDRAVERLVGLGYVSMPDRVYPGRVFLPKGPEHARTHHLSLVEVGTEEWRLRLRFRDALRADAGLRAEYAALKRRLAGAHPGDRAAYTAGKDAFVERVLAAHP